MLVWWWSFQVDIDQPVEYGMATGKQPQTG